MSSLRHRVENAVAGMAGAVVRRLPRRAALAAGAFGGLVMYGLDVRHRRITHRNLERALGDTHSAAERRRIARQCWMNFGRISFDTLNFPRLAGAEGERVTHYEGLEHIRAAYDRGKGVLLFSGHYGHWELVAFRQGALGLPLALVTRPLDNPLLEARLARLRTLTGNEIIHRRGAVRKMVSYLRKGWGVAIVIDQDARKRGVFVPFFGRMASTTPTLAAIALKTGAAVVPVFAVPRDDGSYRIIYEPPVSIEATGDREADVLRVTAACTAIIERRVRRDPGYWMWMHRRWKSRPGGGKERW